MQKFSYLAVVTAAFVGGSACDGDAETVKPLPYDDLRVDLDVPADGYQIASTPFLIQPGQELEKCDIVRIEPHDSEKLIWIQGFESQTSLGTHHMNVLAGQFSVLDTVLRGMAEGAIGMPLGQYDCKDLGDLMRDQNARVFYPSQAAHQSGRLPEGVAYPAVVPLVLIMSHHYINTTARPILVDAKVNLVRVEEAEVKTVAGFVWGSDEDISIPAKSRKLEGGTCRFDRDMNLIAISSHTHAGGECFTMNLFDGESQSVEKEPFFVNKAWDAPPIQFFDQQDWTGGKVLPVKKGDGITFGCHYRNDEDRTVVKGPSAQDEMCIFVSIAFPSKLTVASVKDTVEHPTLDGFEKFSEDSSIPCIFTPDESSPWPDLQGKVELVDGGAPSACADLAETR